MVSDSLIIRSASRKDIALIVGFIEALADYEKLRNACQATEELMEAALFAEVARAHCLIAEWEGKPAGFALYFYNFSTFLGRAGIYIEDVFVSPDYRRKGIARALFAYLAAQAVREGCGRLEWSVLDWNAPAIDFYGSLGAMPMQEWITQRLSGEALLALASCYTCAGDVA